MGFCREKKRGPNAWRIYTPGRNPITMRFLGTEAEAKRAHDAFMAKHCPNGVRPNTGAKGPTRAFDFATYCADRYWPDAASGKGEWGLAASTLEIRRYQLDTLGDFFGQDKLTDMDEARFAEFQAWYADDHAEKHDGEPPKNSTINTLIARALTVLSHARQHGVPAADPKVEKLPELATRTVHVWTEAQMNAYLAACLRIAPHFFGVALFMASTGCRPGEAIEARRSWIYLDSRQVVIPCTEYWQPKDRQPRALPLTDVLAGYLTSRIAELRPKDPLFLNRDGKAWAKFPKRTFYRVRDAAGHADGCGQWRSVPAAPPIGSEHDEPLLQHIKANPKDSAGKIAAALGLHVDYVKTRLRRLEEYGRLKCDREGRGATRTVIERAAPLPIGVCTCGFESLTGGPYTIRHTFASGALRRIKMFQLAKILGHSEQKTTELYSHFSRDHLAEAQNAVSFGAELVGAELLRQVQPASPLAVAR
jgi:integrase